MTSTSPTYSPAQPNCPSARLMPDPSRAYCRKSPDGLTRSVTGHPTRARPPPGVNSRSLLNRPIRPVCQVVRALVDYLSHYSRPLPIPDCSQPGGRTAKRLQPAVFRPQARPAGRIAGRASLPFRAAGGARPGGRALADLAGLLAGCARFTVPAGAGGLWIGRAGARPRRPIWRRWRAASGLRRGRAGEGLAGRPGRAARRPEALGSGIAAASDHRAAWSS